MTDVRFSFLLFLLISSATHAQMYKWVGADGQKNYSDIPPPKTAIHTETKAISVAEKSVTLPYVLEQASKNMPVTLYSADKVAQSADARTFLIKNGIPFSEKTVATNEDIDKLRQISGAAQVPVLFIGRSKLTGFNASEWRTTLTEAGYPESNVLPADYHFSAPQPLVPVHVEPKQMEAENEANHRVKPQPLTRDSNTFHF